MPLILVALAAGLVLPPDVPPAVQIIREGDSYALRSNDPAMPLYTYDRDPPNESMCLKACAAGWPPLAAPANARPVDRWTTIVRADGIRQWTFAGKPVYRHKGDGIGRPTGDGSGGVWHLLATIPVR